MTFLMSAHVQQCLSLAILGLSEKSKNRLIPVFDQKLRVRVIQACMLYSNIYGKITDIFFYCWNKVGNISIILTVCKFLSKSFLFSPF